MFPCGSPVFPSACFSEVRGELCSAGTARASYGCLGFVTGTGSSIGVEHAVLAASACWEGNCFGLMLVRHPSDQATGGAQLLQPALRGQGPFGSRRWHRERELSPLRVATRKVVGVTSDPSLPWPPAPRGPTDTRLAVPPTHTLSQQCGPVAGQERKTAGKRTWKIARRQHGHCLNADTR